MACRRRVSLIPLDKELCGVAQVREHAIPYCSGVQLFHTSLSIIRIIKNTMHIVLLAANGASAPLSPRTLTPQPGACTGDVGN